MVSLDTDLFWGSPHSIQCFGANVVVLYKIHTSGFSIKLLRSSLLFHVLEPDRAPRRYVTVCVSAFPATLAADASTGTAPGYLSSR